MKQIFTISFLLFLIFANATIINIPADQPTIQAGIDFAVDSDTVLVQPGTYFENISYIGKNITVASLFLTTQDTTYISQTIIDGNGNGCVILIANGESQEAILTGFTITNGHSPSLGGGIVCYGTNPLLKNLIITGNSANSAGGGISCSDSNPVLENITISDNTAVTGGGGMYFDDSTPTLTDMMIINNSSLYGGGIYSLISDLNLVNVTFMNNISNINEWCEGGGGIYCRQSTLNLEYVNFENNTAISSGGGLFCKFSTLNILNSEFTNNHSLYEPSPNQFGGGGMFCYGGSSYVENVTFSNNTAISNGGGFGLNISDAVMNNVFVTNNSALSSGGGIYLKQSIFELTNMLVINNTTEGSGGGLSISSTMGEYPLLTNVTIADNSSANGGGIFTMLGGPRLTNCILWNNEPEEIYGIDHFNGPPVIAITHSDIQGGEEGIVFENGTVYWLLGNIDEDPLFLGVGDYPYSLNFDSPCIDAGTLTFVPGYELPEFDLLGNTRIWGDTVDMGAYEWQGTGTINDMLPITNIQLTNYPNPFNPTTTIEFSIQNISQIEISIFNIKGQKIKTLVQNEFTKGSHSIVWDGEDAFEKKVSSGIYLYKLFVNGKIEAVKKCLLLK